MWAERVMGAVAWCRKASSLVVAGVNPRVDDAALHAAALGLTGSRSQRADLRIGVRREGGWSRAVMVICSAVLVAAAVVLAVADRLA
ncbi:hypothetical protein GCM10010350_81500 [Streptomyces galilaeus]|nr:hypothetical protein GCM10010350_81500 [Streptomyces galilaeus]